MKFDIDEKVDMLNKLKAQYQKASGNDKKLILQAIQMIESEDGKFMFGANGEECSWQKIYDFIYKQDDNEFKASFMA